MTETKTILLSRFEYCLVRDNNTGGVSPPHEGPKRLQLESHQELLGGVQGKIRLAEGEYVRVLNPFDVKKGDIIEGEKEVRVGPLVFSLYHGEELEGGRKLTESVLTDDDALLLRAEREAPNPLKPAETILAGTDVLLKGPCRFIPHKYIAIRESRRSISLAEAEGVYIQDDDTGVVRLVKGPADFFLEHNESRWKKRLTEEELQALGYADQPGIGNDGSRVLSATPRPRAQSWEAVVIDLEQNEAICLFDGDKSRVVFGPRTVFLGPHERPKVLFISGGVPVRPNVLRIAKLGLGPDFIRDCLVVRTGDNATLALDLNFRWRFLLDKEAPEKLFALKDFVGFTAQTLSSEIREEAAKHKFEVFHSKAAELVKRAIFKDAESRIFASNGLEIFGVDVEGITPEDPEIRKKLAEAIKTNADIYTRRVREEAELESQRLLIEGRKKNEEARQSLIELEVANRSALALAETKVELEATRLRAEAKAAALRIKAEAKREVEIARLKVEADHEKIKLKLQSDFLETEGGRRSIEIERVRALKATDKILSLPAYTRLFLGSGSLLDAGLSEDLTGEETPEGFDEA